MRLFSLVARLLLSPLGLATPAITLYYGNGYPPDQLRAFDIVVAPDHGHDPEQYRRPVSPCRSST